MKRVLVAASIAVAVAWGVMSLGSADPTQVASSPDVGAIDDSLMKRMSADGVPFETLAEPSSVRIPRDEAYSAAREWWGNDVMRLGYAGYGHFVVPSKGTELDLATNRGVWLFVFDDVEQPVFGPPGERHSTFTADLWIAVSSETGEVVGAQSL